MELLPNGDFGLLKQADCNTQAGKETVLQSIHACGFDSLDVRSVAQASRMAARPPALQQPRRHRMLTAGGISRRRAAQRRMRTPPSQ